jgi:hypothetical protein
MNNLIKIFGLILILPLCSFGANNASKTIYIVERSASSPDKLTVNVNRTTKHSTKLILSGISMGVMNQVQNVICDKQLIKEDSLGIWSVPENCQKLSWQIPLLESGKEPAAKQQSLKSGNFILLSDVSSIPHLQDASSDETIKIEIDGTKKTYPLPNPIGLIPLPNSSAAPIFILLNATVVDSIASESIKLTYLLDNHEFVSALPNVTSHMNGLKWLNTIIPGRKKENFVIAWLGISKKQMTLGGATGNDILLSNYPNDGELTFGKAMLLYVALHEAFHQFALHYPDQPTWVAESLAAYYGARAVQIALPNDSKSDDLMKRFQADGDRFTNGLLIINRKIQQGNRSEYGAFYTKALAFWIAVDNVLQTQGDILDNHLLAVLKTKYTSDGEPVDLQKILNLSPQI